MRSPGGSAGGADIWSVGYGTHPRPDSSRPPRSPAPDGSSHCGPKTRLPARSRPTLAAPAAIFPGAPRPTRPPMLRTSPQTWMAHLLKSGNAPGTALARKQSVKRFSAWLLATGQVSVPRSQGTGPAAPDRAPALRRRAPRPDRDLHPPGPPAPPPPHRRPPLARRRRLRVRADGHGRAGPEPTCSRATPAPPPPSAPRPKRCASTSGTSDHKWHVPTIAFASNIANNERSREEPE